MRPDLSGRDLYGPSPQGHIVRLHLLRWEIRTQY